MAKCGHVILSVSVHDMPAIIGQQGASINALEAEHTVSIDLNRDDMTLEIQGACVYVCVRTWHIALRVAHRASYSSTQSRLRA